MRAVPPNKGRSQRAEARDSPRTFARNEMNPISSISDSMLDFYRKFAPRRYSPASCVHSYLEARKWAERIDWKNNPYDRYSLHRELFYHVVRYSCKYPSESVFKSFDRETIKEEIRKLVEEFERGGKPLGVFSWVFLEVFWLHEKRSYGDRRFSKLGYALEKIEMANEGRLATASPPPAT